MPDRGLGGEKAGADPVPDDRHRQPPLRLLPGEVGTLPQLEVGQVIAVTTGPPRRQHTGHSVEGIHGKAGIIRDGGFADRIAR